MNSAEFQSEGRHFFNLCIRPCPEVGTVSLVKRAVGASMSKVNWKGKKIFHFKEIDASVGGGEGRGFEPSRCDEINLEMKELLKKVLQRTYGEDMVLCKYRTT